MSSQLGKLEEIYLPAAIETGGCMPAWTESAWASPSGTSTLGSCSFSSSPRAGAELAAWTSLDEDIIQGAKN